jgi:hypothetical protein
MYARETFFRVGDSHAAGMQMAEMKRTLRNRASINCPMCVSDRHYLSPHPIISSV